MAHSNGIIYVDTTTTPHTGISIADVQAVLRTSAMSDIGGLITYADAHDLIKKYAKYKPFRDAGLYAIEESRRSANYGLYIPWYSRIGTMVGDIYDEVWSHAENYDALRTPWEWEAPRGAGRTPKEWFRLLDFDGYNSNAQAMAGQVSSPVVVPVGELAASFLFPYHYNQYDIAPSDLIEHGGLDNTQRYLGVCMFTGKASNQRKVYTLAEVEHYDDETIHSLIAAWNPAAVGTYYVLLFVSDRQIADGDADTNGAYIPILPSISRVGVQLESWHMSNLVIEADQVLRTVGIEWSVELSNNASKQATATYIYYYDNAGTEEEYARDTETITLYHGTNTGTHDKNNVLQIISRVVMSIDITDSVHGNDHVNAQAYITQL